MSRIPGPAILGLSDLFIGAAPLAAPGKATAALPAGGQRLTVLVKPGARPGATPGKAAPGPQMAQGPGPKPGQLRPPAKPIKGGNNKDGFAHAKAAAFNAMKAADRATAAAKKAATSVKKYGTAVKLGYHAPLVPLELVGVLDDGQVVLGAAAPAKKALTPAQTKAVQKHTALVAKTAQSAQRLARLAKSAQVKGQAANQAAKKTTAAIADALKLKGRPPALVGGGDDVALGLDLYYDFVGAGPDPDRPGYLTDGSIDPAVLLGEDFDPNAMPPPADPNAPVDPNAPADPGIDPSAYELPPEAGEGAVVAPDGTVLYDPANDPEVIPIPQRGGKLSQEEAFSPWERVSDDAIIYTGAGPGWTETSVASWNFFYGPKTGDGQYGDGYYQGPNNQWWARNNGAMFPKGNTFSVEDDSTTRGWGPLIGKPGSPLDGLQYAYLDKKWFWQGKYAPKWAAQETDAKIETANKAIIAANRAAALVQAAQMQKDLFEQAQAKAKQDAANALALSAADTQSQISQKQVEAQKQQVEVQTQKAELDAMKIEAQMAAAQQQAELQAAQQQAQLDAQAQHALITQADVWNQWAKQNPAEAVQQMQQGLAPGGPAYGPPAYDDEYYEGESYEASDNDGPRMYGPGGGGGGGEEEDGGGEFDAEGD